MVVPPGEGLVEFVSSLAGKPVRVGDLRESYDDDGLVDEMLASLAAHGFLRVTPVDKNRPLVRARRRTVVVDLDSVSSLPYQDGGEVSPEVLLRAERLADHGEVFEKLARRRAAGSLRAHHIVVRVRDVRGAERVAPSLVRLGAAVEIDALPWPAPVGPVPGLSELVRALVATHAVMEPGASLLDPEARRRCVVWCRERHVSGLCLRLEPKAFDPGRDTDAFEAVRELETELGDVVVSNLPADEVILGNLEGRGLEAATSEAARRFRTAYLRWRVPIVQGLESDCPWSQLPEIEDRWVRSAEDLLPNHPELLGLEAGSTVVDVCGGMGRVARRLSPAVGPEGRILSIELRRFLTERARRFADEGGFVNLQFRPGLAERLPLADGTVDAAVNEWTGAIWELGLGPAMIGEMARVVRPGGRIAVTHRLVHLPLRALGQPWVQYERIYDWVRDAFRHPDLAIVAERIWGQTIPSRAGDPVSLWREQYLPRLVDPYRGVYPPDDADRGSSHADVYLTLVAERR